MATLLYVEASPRKARSASIAVARAFLDAHATAHPGDRIDTLDVWSAALPEFDGDTIAAKYAVMRQQDPTGGQAAAWDAVRAVFARFAAADKYLFGVPMWNFGVPYKLKHYIDVVTQPGLAFAASADGTRGLVTGRPAAVVYARGGAYPAGTPGAADDFQKPYLELWLRFIGFTDIRPIVVEPTLGPPARVAEATAAAVELARTTAGQM